MMEKTPEQVREEAHDGREYWHVVSDRYFDSEKEAQDWMRWRDLDFKLFKAHAIYFNFNVLNGTEPLEEAK